MKNFFEISVLKEGEDLPKDCIVEDVEGAAGVKVMHGIGEDDIPTTAAFLFDKRKWSEAQANNWMKDREDIANMKPVKSYDCELKNFDDEKLSFDATASTSEVDRDGDILRASGWILKRFKQNPVMLWSHNSMMLPVGRAENVRKEGDALTFTPVFTPADINPLGEQIYKMFKAKFLNAFSVCFDPFEWKEREEPEGKGANERYGKEYTKLELLEISPVTIPANASALINRDFQNMMFKGMLLEKSATVEDPAIKEKLLEGIIHPVKSETKPEIKKDEKAQYNCECIKCGHKLKSPEGKHCKDIKCPKCGGTMRRLERPGPGQAGYEDKPGPGQFGLKSGRVLSAKNRTLVNTAIESIGKTSGALQALLEAAEPQAGFDTDDELSKLKEDLDKIGDEEGVERIIQDGNNVLREIEEGGK